MGAPAAVAQVERVIRVSLDSERKRALRAEAESTQCVVLYRRPIVPIRNTTLFVWLFLWSSCRRRECSLGSLFRV